MNTQQVIGGCIMHTSTNTHEIGMRRGCGPLASAGIVPSIVANNANCGTGLFAAARASASVCYGHMITLGSWMYVIRCTRSNQWNRPHDCIRTKIVTHTTYTCGGYVIHTTQHTVKHTLKPAGLAIWEPCSRHMRSTATCTASSSSQCSGETIGAAIATRRKNPARALWLTG